MCSVTPLLREEFYPGLRDSPVYGDRLISPVPHELFFTRRPVMVTEGMHPVKETEDVQQLGVWGVLSLDARALAAGGDWGTA